MAAIRFSKTMALAGIPLVGLGVLLSAGAGADPYHPHDPPQLWPDAGSPAGWAADPPPLQSATQWLLTFRYQAGRVQLVAARQVQLPHPVPTPRRIGRYAVELLSGPDLVDRVRFDFPLLAADELAGQARRPFNDPPRFEVKAVVTHQVMVPDSSRISRARLVDRATRTTTMLPWPPAVLGDGGADGGADAAEGGYSRDGGTSDGGGPADGWPMPDVWSVPDAWSPPVFDGSPGPRDGGPLEASR